jgi:hypothetical protein
MAGTVYYRFLIRSYTTSQWAALSDPVLLEREMGVELDDSTGEPIGCKFGNGSTPWKDLPYLVLGLGELDLTTLADGDTLQYDATNGAWAAVPLSASSVSYDNATSGLTATDVQAAIDELAATPASSTAIDIRDVWLLG